MWVRIPPETNNLGSIIGHAWTVNPKEKLTPSKKSPLKVVRGWSGSNAIQFRLMNVENES